MYSDIQSASAHSAGPFYGFYVRVCVDVFRVGWVDREHVLAVIVCYDNAISRIVTVCSRAVCVENISLMMV